MKVTVCEIDPRPGRLEQSMAALTAHVRASAPDFLLLPEMCFSDWLAASPTPRPDRWRESVEAHEKWIATLGAVGVAAIMGTSPIVTGDGQFRNEAWLWTGDGDPLPVHQKHYLPEEPGYWEASWYTPGPRSFELAQTGGAKIGTLICTELWFFEWARAYGRAGAELLVVPRATPSGSRDKWLMGGRAAAVSSGAYCLSSNLRTGQGTSTGEGNHPMDLGGQETDLGRIGWIIDPDGEILATTSEDAPCITLEIDLDLAREAKTTYPRYVKG